MAFDPGYGQTLASYEEIDALTPGARAAVGEPVRKVDLYDLEQAVWAQVAEAKLNAVLEGTLTVEAMLTDHFVRELHSNLYRDIWIWSGRYRTRQTNIGVAPAQIAADLRTDLASLAWRWSSTTSMSARLLGIAAHATVVRTHPFVDGNGRSTRLLADLVFAGAQSGAELFEYDWDVDRSHYIRLLAEFDRTRDPEPLAQFVPVRPIGG